jgi:hypothetical protein
MFMRTIPAGSDKYCRTTGIRRAVKCPISPCGLKKRFGLLKLLLRDQQVLAPLEQQRTARNSAR